MMQKIVAVQDLPSNTLTRALKKEFKAAPVKFMERIQKLEQQQKVDEEKRVQQAAPVEAEPVDETEERLLGLIEELRQEYRSRR